jgi:hypothetical protein
MNGNLCSAWAPGTVASSSAGMFIPGRTCRDLKWRTVVQCRVSYHIVAVDFRRLERHDDVTFSTLPESEVVRKTFSGRSDGLSECR